MGILSEDFKDGISHLSSKEKDRIIFAMARKNEELYLKLSYDYLGYPNKKELDQEIRNRMTELFDRVNPEKPLHRQVVVKLNLISKELEKFQRITKDLEMYIDLHIYLVKEMLERFPHLLGSPKTSLDSRIVQMVYKLYKLIGNLHPDYWMEYKNDMDHVLGKVHRHSSHLMKVKKLPRKFELV